MDSRGGAAAAVLGREPELAVLGGLLDGLAAGRRGAALIEGEPGIGRTALLDEVAATARWRGLPVRRTRYPAGDQRPGTADQRPGTATGIHPLPRSGGPLLLALDDLHRADDESLLMLERLYRAGTAPVLLVGTLCPTPCPAALARLRRAVRATRGTLLSLDPLSTETVAELAARHLGARPGPRLARWLGRAGGNPAYLRDMLDALAGREAVSAHGGVVELTADTEPPVVPVAKRLDPLDAETRELLSTGALLGPEFLVADLSAVLGRSAGALAGAVREAVATGILESAGPALRFRHPIVRDALYQTIPRRAAAYRAAVDALTARGAPVTRVAPLVATVLHEATGHGAGNSITTPATPPAATDRATIGPDGAGPAGTTSHDTGSNGPDPGRPKSDGPYPDDPGTPDPAGTTSRSPHPDDPDPGSPTSHGPHPDDPDPGSPTSHGPHPDDPGTPDPDGSGAGAAGSGDAEVADAVGWAVDWAAGQASGIVRHAPESAAELLGSALRRIGADDARASRLRDGLATVTFELHRYGPAEPAAWQLLDSADPTQRGPVTWIRAYSLLRAGRVDRALDLTVRRADDSALSREWRDRLAALHATMMLADARPGAAERMAGRLLADSVDGFATGHARYLCAVTRLLADDLDGCVDQADRGLAAVGTGPDLADVRTLLYNARVLALAEQDRTGPAAETLRDAEATRTRPPVAAAALAYQQGRWDDALAALAVPAERDPACPVLAHGIGALIAVHRDDRRAATDHLAAVPKGVGGLPVGWMCAGYVPLATALRAERSGRPDRALAAVRVVLDARYGADPDYPALAVRGAVLPTLVRLALAAGDGATARRAADVAAAGAADDPHPRRTAIAAWCRGLVEADPDQVLAAAGYASAAARPLELGNALEDAAFLEAAVGDPGTAQDALTEAIEVYTGLGAGWAARRAARRLQPYGIRTGAAAARRTHTGPAVLTVTETRVAHLVVQGRSNAEIAAELLLSRRTVETHVSNILAKLQVGSRREITVRLQDGDATAN